MIRHKGKKKITTVRTGAAPTRERRYQNGGVITETVDCDANGKILVNRYRAAWECPLDAYRDRKIITEPEYRAGLQFRQAYHRAVLSRRATRERLNNYPSSTGLTMSEKLINDARRTLSPHNMGTVIDVCGHDQHIWRKEALEKLRKGLGHLAFHWDMAAIEVCEHKRKTI